MKNNNECFVFGCNIILLKPIVVDAYCCNIHADCYRPADLMKCDALVIA